MLFVSLFSNKFPFVLFQKTLVIVIIELAGYHDLLISTLFKLSVVHFLAGGGELFVSVLCLHCFYVFPTCRQDVDVQEFLPVQQKGMGGCRVPDSLPDVPRSQSLHENGPSCD